MLEGERWKLTRFYLDLTMVPTPSFLGGNFLTVMKYVCRLFFFAKKFKMKSLKKNDGVGRGGYIFGVVWGSLTGK